MSNCSKDMTVFLFWHVVVSLLLMYSMAKEWIHMNLSLRLLKIKNLNAIFLTQSSK